MTAAATCSVIYESNQKSFTLSPKATAWNSFTVFKHHFLALHLWECFCRAWHCELRNATSCPYRDCRSKEMFHCTGLFQHLGMFLFLGRRRKNNPQNSPSCSPSYEMVFTFTTKILCSFREMLQPGF